MELAKGCIRVKWVETLRDEHRSIAAVLQGMLYLVRERREHGRNVDSRIFRAMLYYLDVFPGRTHHPKEEAVLFEALRCRSRAIDSVLDELTGEHETLERGIGQLEQLLLRYVEGGDAEFPAFATHAERYANEYLEHLCKEEDLVLPYALKVLSAEDWDEMDATLEIGRAHV